jgi:hypothetical protein
MSTLTEIEAALLNPSDAELIIAADRAFQEYDKAEGTNTETVRKSCSCSGRSLRTRLPAAH